MGQHKTRSKSKLLTDRMLIKKVCYRYVPDRAKKFIVHQIMIVRMLKTNCVGRSGTRTRISHLIAETIAIRPSYFCRLIYSVEALSLNVYPKQCNRQQELKLIYQPGNIKYRNRLDTIMDIQLTNLYINWLINYKNKLIKHTVNFFKSPCLVLKWRFQMSFIVNQHLGI